MEIRPGLQLLEDVPGHGRQLRRGDRVSVRLDGWLNHGERIQHADEVQLVVGRRTLIAGLGYAIDGMAEGGRRRVRIGPHLAYGDRGVPGRIPPRAVLVYEIVVVAVDRDADG